MSKPEFSASARRAVARLTGVPEDASDADMKAALDEYAAEGQQQREEVEVASLPVFTLPEAAEPPPSVRDVPGFGDVWQPVDVGALAEVRARADASARLMRELGKLVGVQTSDPAVLVAAVNEALTEAAEVPAGHESVPADELAQLRADHEAQRTHRERMAVDAAVMAGKIAASQAETWVEWFAADAAGTQARLDKMQRNTVPVAPIGTADEPDDETYHAWVEQQTARATPLPAPTPTTEPGAGGAS
ncbi:hypothetical protein [Kribbella swartbergensis]